MTRLCPNCGGPYRAFASYVKRGGSKTCGRKCPKRPAPKRPVNTIHSVRRTADPKPPKKIPYPAKPKQWGGKIERALDRTFRRKTTPDLQFTQR